MAAEKAAIPEAERKASWLIKDATLKEFNLLLPYQSIGKSRKASQRDRWELVRLSNKRQGKDGQSRKAHHRGKNFKGIRCTPAWTT